MKFLTNQPAFLLEKTLVIADIHVGIEYEYFRSGIKVPSQTDKILERVKKLIKETNAKKLLILGDLKHKVPGTSYQEKREVPEFLNELDDLVEIEIVAGNHDGGLKSMLSNDIKLHPSKGFLSGNVYFCHGNSWPSKEFLKADYIIMGHIHPLFEIKDKLGYRWSERIWVRAELGKKKIEEKYGKSKKIPKLIIVPAFNEMAGGKPINKEDDDKRYIGPLAKCMKKPEITMLDGVLLGKT